MLKRIVALSWTVVLPCCSYVPLEKPGMTPLPMPDALRQRLTPQHRAQDLTLEVLETTPRHERFHFRFATGYPDFPEVEGEYLRVSWATAAQPAALLQIAPILGGAGDGYLTSRVFADWAADAGLSSFFLYQEETILDPERAAAELDGLLVQQTLENIQALEMLSALPEVDAERLGCFGVSMGAIRNVLLLAVVPQLKGGIFCLPGADLPRIFRLSRERMVERYLEERAEIARVDREAIVDDLEANIHTNPMHLARYINPERAILFLGALDDKVPYATGLKLYHAIGAPELHIFPLGHYTSMVAAPRAASIAFDWLHGKFGSQKSEVRGQGSVSEG